MEDYKGQKILIWFPTQRKKGSTVCLKLTCEFSEWCNRKVFALSLEAHRVKGPVMPQLSVARGQARKIGCAVCVGGIAWHLHLSLTHILMMEAYGQLKICYYILPFENWALWLLYFNSNDFRKRQTWEVLQYHTRLNFQHWRNRFTFSKPQFFFLSEKVLPSLPNFVGLELIYKYFWLRQGVSIEIIATYSSLCYVVLSPLDFIFTIPLSRYKV